ncbi:MAG: oligosaccharide flippase family protein [Pseudomonadota bacterium]
MTGAVGWNFTNIGVTFALRLASNLIMTRLLMPDAFGLLAFAMTFATAVTLLTDLGIHQSIVREKDQMGPRFLRTAWTVKIVRSLVISLGVLGLSFGLSFIGPKFAQPGSVMAHPEMPLLIALTALAPLLEGLVSTNWTVCLRNMQFRPIAFLEIGSSLIRIASQIAFALISPTVWALLVGMLVGGIAKALLSHLFLQGPRMRLTWEKTIAASLWSYGKWIMGSSLMSFFIRNSDKLVFGAYLSSVSMGLYVIAFIWIGAGQRVANIFVQSLGFPLVAELMRDRPDEARRLMRKYQTALDIFCLIGFCLLVLLGPALISLLYTPVYEDAGYLIQLLAPLLLAVRFDQLTNVLVAGGDSRALFWIATLVAVATLAFLNLGLYVGGLEAAITGMMLARFVSLPYLLIKTLAIFGPKQTAYDTAFGVGSIAATLGLYLFL